MSGTLSPPWTGDTTYVHKNRESAAVAWREAWPGEPWESEMHLHWFARSGNRLSVPGGPRRPLVAPPPIPAGTRDPSAEKGGEATPDEIADLFDHPEPLTPEPSVGEDQHIGEAAQPVGAEADTTEEDHTMTMTVSAAAAPGSPENPAALTGEIIPAGATPIPPALPPAGAMTVPTGAPMPMMTSEPEIGTIAEIGAHVKLVGDLMREHLKEGIHYGTIPGTDKKSLYKAGAEKLGLLFKLVPRYNSVRTDLPNGHREWTIECALYHKFTGRLLGSGVGSCSSMEPKYRYRNEAAYVDTGEPIPKDSKDRKTEYRKQGFGMRKIEGAWCWVKYGDDKKVENPDIADTYNTILKMAKKRALVDASIQATATSDLLTQDVNDPEKETDDADRGGSAQAGGDAQPASANPEQPKQEPARQENGGGNGGSTVKGMSEAQAGFLGRLERQHNTPVAHVCSHLANNPPTDPKVAGVVWTRPNGSPAPFTSAMASFLIDGYMKNTWDQL